MRRLLTRILPLMLVAAAAACDGDDDPTVLPTPLPPVQESFSGTLTINGAVTHTFPTDGGTVTATLTELLPDPIVAVGLTLGVWNGTACQAVISDDDAIQGAVVVGAATASGVLCVRIHDVGRLTEPATYTLQVSHP